MSQGGENTIHCDKTPAPGSHDDSRKPLVNNNLRISPSLEANELLRSVRRRCDKTPNAAGISTPGASKRTTDPGCFTTGSVKIRPAGWEKVGRWVGRNVDQICSYRAKL